MPDVARRVCGCEWWRFSPCLPPLSTYSVTRAESKWGTEASWEWRGIGWGTGNMPSPCLPPCLLPSPLKTTPMMLPLGASHTCHHVRDVGTPSPSSAEGEAAPCTNPGPFALKKRNAERISTPCCCRQQLPTWCIAHRPPAAYPARKRKA